MELRNILKVRDDLKPTIFIKSDSSYVLKSKVDISWIKNSNLTNKDLRSRIEPWLTALFQSEHLSLLIGAGLTHAVHFLATDTPAIGMEPIHFEKFQDKIDSTAKNIAMAVGRKHGNLEDQLRIAIELLRGLQILQKEDQALALKALLENGMKSFAEAVLRSELALLNPRKINENWNSPY